MNKQTEPLFRQGFENQSPSTKELDSVPAKPFQTAWESSMQPISSSYPLAIPCRCYYICSSTCSSDITAARCVDAIGSLALVTYIYMCLKVTGGHDFRSFILK